MREIRLEFPGGASGDELRGLRDRLSREGELRGRVDLVGSAPEPGTLSGGVWEAIALKIAEDVAGGIAADYVIAALKAAVDWARHGSRSRTQRTMVVRLPDGTGVPVDIERLRSLVADQQRAEFERIAKQATEGMGIAGDDGSVDAGPASVGPAGGRSAMDLRMPGSRAVLIGTGRYTMSSPQLRDIRAVDATVSALSDMLTSRCGMAWEDITPLRDRGDVGDVKRSLSREARAAEGVLFVYYAGHGLLGPDGELYLSLGNTDPEDLEATAVSFASVSRRLAESSARAIIVILDCCFSGNALTPYGSVYQGITVPRGIDGGYILAAAARDELAMAPAGARHTAFTGELLTYLKDGDADGGESLTMGSAARYLQRVLRAKGFPQPEPGSSGAGDQIVLAGNPQAAPQTASMLSPQPAEFPQPTVVSPEENALGADSDMPRGDTIRLKKAQKPVEDPTRAEAPVPDPVPPVPFQQPSEQTPPPNPPGQGPPPEDQEQPGRPNRKLLYGLGAVALLAIIALIVFLKWPGPKPNPNPGPTASPGPAAADACPKGASTLTLVGSTAFQAIATSAVDAWHCPTVKFQFNAQDSASGFSALGHGNPQAGATIEMYDGTDTSQTGFKSYPVGAVVFAIVANKGFGQPDVSIQELKQVFVYGSRKGTVAAGRPRGSGSRKALLSGLLHVDPSSVQPGRTCTPSTTDKFCTVGTTKTMLSSVNGQANEIGYAGLQEFNDNSPQYPNLNIVRIGGTGPSAQSVEGEQYNFWALEHLYTVQSPSTAVTHFVAFLRTYLASQQEDGFVGCAHVPAGPDNDCRA